MPGTKTDRSKRDGTPDQIAKRLDAVRVTEEALDAVHREATFFQRGAYFPSTQRRDLSQMLRSGTPKSKFVISRLQINVAETATVPCFSDSGALKRRFY
ncbi:hypothetical protein RMSM_07791 [Rhodopirellula maiorica SM1]|uniref:Uncharacterized protein n=1 Tax=Rhodopirellula maiorica SM1 TaxID=1265738 RepID=M5RIV6_9BACT|nr:hypothetical protein [Rhodopirellula maiorica]EMI15282.1 hypothetical protein RMSM_07791 [Rhodopirellula maiorica SM1]